MTAQTPGCGSNTDAKKRQREAEAARAETPETTGLTPEQHLLYAIFGAHPTPDETPDPAESDYLAHDDVPIPAQCIHMRGCDCKRAADELHPTHVAAAREADRAEVERLRALADEQTAAAAKWRGIAKDPGRHDVCRQAELLLTARAVAAEAAHAALVAKIEALAEKWRYEGITCECGHYVGSDHNSNGCYAVVTYTPLVRCSCSLTDDQHVDEIAASSLRALIPADSTALDEVRAQAKAEGLREAADALEGRLGTDGAPVGLWEFRQWLRARADRIGGAVEAARLADGGDER